MDKITFANSFPPSQTGINVAYFPGRLGDAMLSCVFAKTRKPFVAIVTNCYAQGTMVDITVFTGLDHEPIVTRQGIPAAGLFDDPEQCDYNKWDWPLFSN